MEYLVAAMAFAVLMIVFSTAVTAITETFLRLRATRADVLANATFQFLVDDPTIQRTIEEGFDKVDEKFLIPAIKMVEDHAEAWLDKLDAIDLKQEVCALVRKIEDIDKRNLSDTDRAKERKAVYDSLAPSVKDGLKDALRHATRVALVKNPAVIKPRKLHQKIFRGFKRFSQKENFDRIDTLSSYSFLQRLAGTDIGKQIAEEAREYAIRGLTMGFERFVAASNEVFRKNAQAMTMTFSILLAFGLNIDAVRLFQYLLDNPGVSEEIIAGAEKFVKVEQDAAAEAGADAKPGASLTDTETTPPSKSGETSVPGDETPAETAAPADGVNGQTDAGTAEDDPSGTQSEAVAEGGGADTPAATGLDAEAKDELKEALKTIEELRAAQNLPIGWTQFPGTSGLCFLPDLARIRIEGWFAGDDAAVAAGSPADKVKPAGDTGADLNKGAPGPGGSGLKQGPAGGGGLFDDIAKKQCADVTTVDYLLWVLKVMLAGFLIGLGGPFWYKVFTGLSHIVQVLRTFRGQPRQEAISKSENDQQKASQPLVHAVEKIDDHTGPQLVNLFRASAGLPAKDFPVPEKSDDKKVTA